jgi:hypothetical protein
MTELGIDAVVAAVALLIWAVAFLPVRGLVRRLIGEDGRSGRPLVAELLMLVHLLVLLVGLVASFEFVLDSLVP